MSTVLSFRARVAPSYEWVPEGEVRLWSEIRELGEEMGRNYSFGLGAFRPWNPLGDATPDLILKPVDDKIAIDDLRTVLPTVEDPALFRNFASMEPTKETILAFAERFGLLSGGQSPTPFYRWEREILQMRFLIAVWDAVTTRKTRFLQTHFTAVADGRFRLPFPELLLRIHIRESQTFFSERCSILQAARQYLAEALTAKCEAIRPKIVVNPRSNELQIEMVQESLGGALWMQFTESIAARRTYRQCKTCGQYIELSPELNRADRRYCSDACRSKALRRRQKLAHQMRESGKTLREVAKATGSDIQTIKQWLQPKVK